MRNLRADPAVTVRVGARCFGAHARVVATTERSLYDQVRARMIAKYGWGDGLVIELMPAV